VNYAFNERWIAWSEEALRRLLKGSGQVKSGTAAALSTKSGNVQTPTSTTPSKPNSWYDEENQNTSVVTPSIFDIEQTMGTPVPIYGHMTQAMALDDNILDIQAVSKQTQKCK
jgi:hypothetical protein